MKIKEFLQFFNQLVKVSLIAVIGGLVTAPAVTDWYSTINKPSFNPPSVVFGPAWTFLFFLMAISAYILWGKAWDEKQYVKAMFVYNIQLGLNLLWSILFFGLKSPIAAFIEIIFLWGAILYTIILFKRISKESAILLVPYLLWVTFAAILNLAIVLLN